MATKKILVADDSVTIQKVIRLALQGEGYEIQAVSDGLDALQQIAVFRPDVVLIDVALPKRNAFEVKQAINAQGDLPDTRFILMSSAFEKYDEGQANAAGFQGKLTKPFDPTSLRAVLNEGESTHTSPPEFTRPSSRPSEQPPAFPGAPGSGSHGLKNDPDDIKNLTESTIRLSGLDDYNWSVNEPGREGTHLDPQFPTMQPQPAMLDLGNSNFDLDLEFSPSPDVEHNEVIQLRPNEFGPDLTSPINLSTASPSLGLSDMNQIESMVTQHVEEALKKITREMLPEIAEKVIKQEIHRLLSELS